MLQELDERERLEYLQRKKQEEEQRRNKEEDDKRADEEAALQAAEEAGLQAELLARYKGPSLVLRSHGPLDEGAVKHKMLSLCRTPVYGGDRSMFQMYTAINACFKTD